MDVLNFHMVLINMIADDLPGLIISLPCTAKNWSFSKVYLPKKGVKVKKGRVFKKVSVGFKNIF